MPHLRFPCPRTLRLRVLFSALAFLVVGNACAPTSLLDRQIEAGGSVASLLGGADTVVVLLYEPSDCFVCYGSLQPWLVWGSRHPGSVALLFTRAPTPAERVQLATYRIRPHAVLRPSVRDRVSAPETPVEMLVVNGRIVSRSLIRQGRLTTALYRQLVSSATISQAGVPPSP